ncbi:MAG: GNAT family N-acetyltransferase [Bacteroidota bacterium]
MINIRKIQPKDTELIELISTWYLNEWNIPVEKTRDNLQAITTATDQFQLILFVDKLPVATGGIYNHVGLLDRQPRLKIHQHWLALVYTIPAYRAKGYGSMLCSELQKQAKQQCLNTLHLFTDTAESLYQNLGWKVQQRLETGGRNLAIMHLQLS